MQKFKKTLHKNEFCSTRNKRTNYWLKLLMETVTLTRELLESIQTQWFVKN